MMKLHRHTGLLILIAVTPLCGAFEPSPACRVEPFQGATSPQGATATIRLVNTGKPCAIVNYGLPGERRNPANSGTITKQPAHGKAKFVAPRAEYVPAPGYFGEDDFAYEASARGASDQAVQLKVRVQVFVSAP